MGEGDNENKVPFTLAMVAGGVAATTVDVVMYPLDTLKTRLQARLPQLSSAPRSDRRARRPPTRPHAKTTVCRASRRVCGRRRAAS